MKMKNTSVKKQIQQMLSYIQRRLVDIQKENILKDLESRSLEYVIVREFLIDLKKEFSGREDETMKVVELKKVD